MDALSIDVIAANAKEIFKTLAEAIWNRSPVLIIPIGIAFILLFWQEAVRNR